MRRLHLAAAALLLALPALGCASFPGYRDFTPEPPPAVAAAPASPEAEALVTRFYGSARGDVSPAITAALGQSPGHAGLHEIAAYDAMLRGDSHAAFDHFLAAAADTGAAVPELYLWEMRSLSRTASEHARAQALLRELAQRHPRQAVRHLAAYDLARELRHVGERDKAAEIVAGLGFIEPWLVIGAFDNDQGKGYEAAYPPEQDADVSRTYQGMRVPIKWRPVSAGKLDGALPLGDVISPAESAVAYAQTWVTAAKPRLVDLRLTTTNAVRVFVDGKQLAADEKILHDELDNVIARIAVSAGPSRILIKSAHGSSGPFRLAARITEIDGSPATDLRFSANAPAGAQPASAGAAKAPGTGIVSPIAALEKLADKNRRRFLEGRMWAREGHARRSSWYYEPLLRDTPENPLVMLFAAVAFRDNAEAGKALDLLNRGVAKHPEAPGFLVERARFYAQRRLWDKAQKDLDAFRDKRPDGRDALAERSMLFAARGWAIDRCQELEALIARAPDDIRAISDLSRCKTELGYGEEGERALLRAHALAPGDALLLTRLVEVSERRLDFGAADGWLKQLREARPESLEALVIEAELRRREGKAEEAQRLFGLARDLSPDAPVAYDKLAQMALEARNKPEAERWWRQALERDPDNVSLAQRLATMSPNALSLGDRMAPSADDIDHAIRSASQVVIHPGSHHVTLLDDEVTTVNPDGSSKRIVTQVSQAVNTEGRDALIQARLPGSGRVTVLEAYSVRKNGERSEASSVQNGIVRFRNFEVGSIAVIQYVHYAPTGHWLPNEYTEQWRFQQGNGQVELSRWRLILPKDRALNVESHGPVETTSEVNGDLKVWSFQTRNAPPLVSEPGMTAAVDELWTTAVSTVKSWDSYVAWEKALLADAFGPSPELDGLARKLTADAKTTREKIDRLWAHVAQEIRYQQEYEDTIAGVKPHSAAMVHERGYGDCKDKAVLLIRLAKVVGVKMSFAILRTTPFGKVMKQIPNQQFNHAIVYVPRQEGVGEGFFIDTTTNGLDIGNMRTDDEGAQSLVLDPDSGKWEFIPIPYQSIDNEFIRHEVKVDLRDPLKATAHDHIETRGSMASQARVTVRGAESAKKFYQNVSDQLFSGTTLIAGKAEHDQDLTRPLSMHLEVDLSNALKMEDDRYRLDVPLIFPISHAVALATRQHPLRLWRGMQSFSMEIDLGDGREVTHVPADFSVEHACFSIARKSEIKGSKITVRTSYRNTCPEIAPADYPAFRAAVQKAVARDRDNIVFGSKGGAKAAKKAAK